MELLVCVDDQWDDWDADDIVNCKPDGFDWGRGERTSPCFKIVQVETDLTCEEMMDRLSNQYLLKCEECGRFMDEGENHPLHNSHREHEPNPNAPADLGTDLRSIVKHRRWQWDENSGNLKKKRISPQGEIAKDHAESCTLKKVLHAHNDNP
jgi:hypothetical protein